MSNFHLCKQGNPVINCPPVSPVPRPSYGNFWRNLGIVSIAGGTALPFNNTGPTAGGISLANSTTINIANPGDYFISYVVTILLTAPQIAGSAVGVFLNGNNEVPNMQTRFGIVVRDPDVSDCLQISGEAIVSIPANSTLQLRNTSPGNQAFTLCDTFINNVALNIIKVSV
jgi:hypothetical protein